MNVTKSSRFGFRSPRRALTPSNASEMFLACMQYKLLSIYVSGNKFGRLGGPRVNFLIDWELLHKKLQIYFGKVADPKNQGKNEKSKKSKFEIWF